MNKDIKNINNPFDVEATGISTSTLDQLVTVTTDNIFLRLPTDQELRDNAVTDSGIITGYTKSKAEMHYDVLGVGPAVVRCKVGDKVVVEAHKLVGISARTVGSHVYFPVRDFDILAVLK